MGFRGFIRDLKNEIPREDASLLAILLALGFLWRGIFIYRNIGWITNYWLFEDWGYSLSIARNMAAGMGETFDGLVGTNGYQPLYVWLMVPVYRIFGSHIIPPIYAAVTILAVFNVLTAVLIYLLLRRLETGRFWSLFGAGFWLFNLNIARTGTNGLESGLAVFLAALAILYATRISEDSGPGKYSALGFILALGFLARVDAVFLWAAVFSYLFFAIRAPFAERIKSLSFAALPILVIAGCYMAFNKYFHGSPLPTSGIAVTSKESLTGFSALLSSLRINPQDTAYAVYIISSMLAGHMTINGYRYANPGLAGPLSIAAAAGVLAFLAVFIFFIKDKAGFFRKYGLHLLCLGFYFYGYTMYYFFPFERYFFPIVLEAVILLSALPAALDKKTGMKPAARAAIAAFSAALFIFNALPHLTTRIPYTFGWKKGVDALNSIASKGDTAAGYQSGNLGYFYRRGRTLNLDGVVNFEAYKAKKSGLLYRFIRSNNVKYIADEGDRVYFIKKYFGGDAEKNDFVSSLRLRHKSGDYVFNIYELAAGGYSGFINFDASNAAGWLYRKDQRMVDDDMVMSSTKGASLSFSTAVPFELKMLRHDWSGIAEIYRDGRLIDRLDLYSPVADPTFHYVWDKTDGSAHEFRIMVTGEKNEKSHAAEVWVDAVLL